MNKILIFCMCFLKKFSSVSAECVWNLNGDLPKVDPIYYSATSSNLIIPGPTGIKLQDNQQMTLICIGKTNTIFGTGNQELTLPCVPNNKLMYNGVAYPLNNFYCSASTLSDVVLTGKPCASGRGELMNLGFNSTKGFATLVEVCYDRINETNIYSINTIYGKTIANAEIESDRPSFRNQGLTYAITPNQYKQTEQLNRLTVLLGATQAAKYITTSSYLSRGHLAPDADYLFGSWSTATYFLVNAAPEWQVVNTGNWLRVENIARDIGIQLQQNLTVYSGTYGVSSLPNASGVKVDLYLFDNNKLPVPKWFWKIIYSASTTKGIAFVTLNNPHVTSESEVLCTNVCAQTNWARAEWTDFSKGYTYCCNVNDLIAKVKLLSPLAISGPITGP